MALRTENGWYQVGADKLDRSPVPGTNIVIPLQAGIASRVLKAFAADFHAYVESLNNARGGTDEGGWTPTNSVATSNHLSGTAMDLNWSDHPFRVSYAGFDQAKINRMRELLAFYEGCIFWGQDWNSPKDPMHVQLNGGTYGTGKLEAFAARKIRADGFSTFNRGGTPAPSPAPVTYWAEEGHSGEHVKRLQQFLNKLAVVVTGLVVDGDFGPATKAAVQAFQRKAGIDADGIVGPITLGKLKDAGFNPDGTPEPPKVKRFPQDFSDRELLEYIAAQLGPGHPAWKPNGPDGEALTQRDSIAAWGKALTEIAEAR